MTHRAALLTALLLPLAGVSVAQDDPERIHVRMHRRIAPSVVYVSGGGQEGSAVCIDKEGILLSSPTACGAATEEVTVVTPAGKQVTARVIGRHNDKELVLLKAELGLPAIELGDSDSAKIGQTTYVFGDCYDSIRLDGQVSVSLGVVSSIYELSKRQRGTYYTGKVIETSAAVNPNQDGGPLIDASGRLLGVVTLNYDESKFTGLAIPINVLKGEIEALLEAHRNPGAVVRTSNRRAGWLGATIEEVDDATGLRVLRLAPNGPAEKAGLKAGDLLTRVNSKRVLTGKGLADILSRLEPGDEVKLRVEREGKELALALTLGRRTEY